LNQIKFPIVFRYQNVIFRGRSTHGGRATRPDRRQGAQRSNGGSPEEHDTVSKSLLALVVPARCGQHALTDQWLLPVMPRHGGAARASS